MRSKAIVSYTMDSSDDEDSDVDLFGDNHRNLGVAGVKSVATKKKKAATTDNSAKKSILSSSTVAATSKTKKEKNKNKTTTVASSIKDPEASGTTSAENEPGVKDTKPKAKESMKVTSPKASVIIVAPKAKNAKTKAVSATDVARASTVTAYDSDEEPPVEDPNTKLQWRGEANENMSDWTIEIVRPSNNNIVVTADTYHVHKLQLCYGARKSDYFVGLFGDGGGRYRESDVGISRIELGEREANAFPKMLDYMYETGGKTGLEITTESAAALHKLGEYFQNRRLRWDAKVFWKKDMKLENLHLYCHDAQHFHDEKLMIHVVKVLVENITEVTPSSEIVAASSADLWLRVLDQLAMSDKANDDGGLGQPPSSKKQPKDASLRVSELIANYALRDVNLSPKMFENMVTEEKIPVVSHKAAISLMEVWDRLHLDSEKETGNNFQARCVASLVSHLSETADMVKSDKTILKNRDASFWGKLLTGVLEKTSEDKKKQETEQTSLKRKLEKVTASSDMHRRYWLSTINDGEKNERKVRKLQSELEAAQVELATLRSSVGTTKHSAK